MNTIYRYACLMRPPAPGAVPRAGLVETKCIEGITPKGHHAWGWTSYDHELTPEDIRHYELEYLHKDHIIDGQEVSAHD